MAEPGKKTPKCVTVFTTVVAVNTVSGAARASEDKHVIVSLLYFLCGLHFTEKVAH